MTTYDEGRLTIADIDRDSLSSPVMRDLYDVTKAVRRALAGETDAKEALEIVLEVAKRLEADGHSEVATSVLGLAASFAECHSIDGHGAN